MTPGLMSSRTSQRAVQIDISPRRSALESPTNRQIRKPPINGLGSYLIELVDPNDGFDLDILSIAENQTNCLPGRVQAKKSSRMFNFDYCSFIVPQQAPTRRSFDCGSARKGPAKELNTRYPQIKDSIGDEDFMKRCPTKRVSLSAKRQTSRPLLINFDQLKEMAQDFKNPDKARVRHVDSIAESPGFNLIRDL